MQTKTCVICKTEYQASSRANNRKYCDTCKPLEYAKAQKAKYQNEYSKRKAKNATFQSGKIQCQICGGWYWKPLAHCWQVHQVSEREYKQHFGLERHGLINEKQKELLKSYTEKYYTKVIKQNLLEKGKNTRFTPNHKINYIRTPQTLERLRKHIKTIGKGRYYKNR